MRYQLTPIHCRPWLVAYLSVKLIESHCENDYGRALRRLNAITEKLQSLDFATTPGYMINGLKREELIALNWRGKRLEAQSNSSRRNRKRLKRRHVRCLSHWKPLDEIGVAGQSHSQ